MSPILDSNGAVHHSSIVTDALKRKCPAQLVRMELTVRCVRVSVFWTITVELFYFLVFLFYTF